MHMHFDAIALNTTPFPQHTFVMYPSTSCRAAVNAGASPWYPVNASSASGHGGHTPAPRRHAYMMAAAARGGGSLRSSVSPNSMWHSTTDSPEGGGSWMGRGVVRNRVMSCCIYAGCRHALSCNVLIVAAAQNMYVDHSCIVDQPAWCSPWVNIQCQPPTRHSPSTSHTPLPKHCDAYLQWPSWPAAP